MTRTRVKSSLRNPCLRPYATIAAKLSGVRSFRYSHFHKGRPSSSCFKRSEEHTSELQSHVNLVCRLLREKKKSAGGFGLIVGAVGGVVVLGGGVVGGGLSFDSDGCFVGHRVCLGGVGGVGGAVAGGVVAG